MMLSPVVKQEKLLKVVSKLQYEKKMSIPHHANKFLEKWHSILYPKASITNIIQEHADMIVWYISKSLTWPWGLRYLESLVCEAAVSHRYP